MRNKQFLFRMKEIINLHNFFSNFNALCDKFLYPLFPYLKYMIEKQRWNQLYTLFNFYWWETVKRFWIIRFIEHNKLNKEKMKIDFFSVFWPRKMINYSKNTKIFYTWEPTAKDMYFEYSDYCLNDVDLSIWFREYEGINNYYRLPLRLISNFLAPEKTDITDIRNVLQEIEIKKNKLNRKKFCALISRHDDIMKTRLNTYNRLSNIWKISCPWRFLHNENINIPRYTDKINYLKDFKFNICPENHLDKWYITEKLIDSLKAWCLPIYNGIFSELEEKVFNKKRIIFIDEDLEKTVLKLNNSNSYYEDFINQPIFNKNADIYIYNHINNFKKALEKVM